MRPKELQCVVTFHTTTEALAFEDVAKEAGFSGRIIPLPRAIAAGCGLAWRENPENRVLIEKLLNEHHLGYDRIYELVI
ncbi:MAG: DUF3343 domain-containing protein [Desulfosporosinus sp.]|jgi:hypothetical protein